MAGRGRALQHLGLVGTRHCRCQHGGGRGCQCAPQAVRRARGGYSSCNGSSLSCTRCLSRHGSRSGPHGPTQGGRLQVAARGGVSSCLDGLLLLVHLRLLVLLLLLLLLLLLPLLLLLLQTRSQAQRAERDDAPCPSGHVCEELGHA